MTEFLYPPDYNGIELQYRFITRQEGYSKTYMSNVNPNVVKSIKDKVAIITKSMNICRQEPNIEVKDNCLCVTFVPINILTDATKLEAAMTIQTKYNQGCVRGVELESTLKQESVLVRLGDEVVDTTITEQEAIIINNKINNIDLGHNIDVVGYWWNKDTDELLLTFSKGKNNKVIPRKEAGNEYGKYKGMFKRICTAASTCGGFVVNNYPTVVKVSSSVDTLVNKSLNISLKVVCLGIGFCILMIAEQVATNVRINRNYLMTNARFLKFA